MGCVKQIWHRLLKKKLIFLFKKEKKTEKSVSYQKKDIATTRAHPSFGMTTIQTIRGLFAWQPLILSCYFSDGLELFRDFLRTEFSEENVEFWIACEEYKNTKSNKNMSSHAHKIFTDFVAVQAPREVGLSTVITKWLILLLIPYYGNTECFFLKVMLLEKININEE